MTQVKVDGNGPYEVDMPVAEVLERVSSAGGGRFNLPLAGGDVVVINPSSAAVIEVREDEGERLRRISTALNSKKLTAPLRRRGGRP
jgi:hypothetical protein